MKIYCNRRDGSLASQLYKFIGKDVWFKVYEKDIQLLAYHLIEEIEDDIVYFKELHVDLHGHYTKSSCSATLEEYERYYSIVDPIQVYTISELSERLGEDIE